MFILCVHLTMHLSVKDITTLEMIIKPKIFMGLFLFASEIQNATQTNCKKFHPAVSV